MRNIIIMLMIIVSIFIFLDVQQKTHFAYNQDNLLGFYFVVNGRVVTDSKLRFNEKETIPSKTNHENSISVHKSEGY